MSKSNLIITDSGGIQEEAPTIGKPCLVTRDKTERPETIISGSGILVGHDKDKIYKNFVKIRNNEKIYKKMSKKRNLYGNGKAFKIIGESISKIMSLDEK